MDKRVLAGAAVVAAMGIGGGVAAGQGSGGTVGTSAHGTMPFTVVIPFGDRSRNGINPAVPRDKKRPKVGDVMAHNFDILMNGKKVGRGHEVDTTTFSPKGKKYRGGAIAVEDVVLDFEGVPGSNTVFLHCLAADAPEDSPCAITGGTGRFAGARGVATAQVSKGKEDRRKKTFTFDGQLEFIP